MEFQVTYDRTTKVVSIATCSVLFVLSMVTKSAVVAVGGVTLLVIAFAFSTRGYLLESGWLVVRRRVGNVRIPLDDVREVRPVTRDDLRGCIRLFGSGGLFGYYGLFRTARLGKCHWYVTDRSRSVVVVTGAKTVLLSPSEPEAFLSALNEFPRGAAPVPAPPGRGAGYDWAGRVAGVAIGSLTLAIVAFASLWAPGPPVLTLTGDSLAIQDRFYPVTLKAGAIDIEHMQVVDITGKSAWRPTMRTNGFANAHYRSGWFRVAAGKTVRMYRADSTRLVLLPPNGDGAPVLVEVTDPENFIARLRQSWGAQSGVR